MQLRPPRSLEQRDGRSRQPGMKSDPTSRKYGPPDAQLGGEQPGDVSKQPGTKSNTASPDHGTPVAQPRPASNATSQPNGTDQQPKQTEPANTDPGAGQHQQPNGTQSAPQQKADPAFEQWKREKETKEFKEFGEWQAQQLKPASNAQTSSSGTAAESAGPGEAAPQQPCDSDAQTKAILKSIAAGEAPPSASERLRAWDGCELLSTM